MDLKRVVVVAWQSIAANCARSSAWNCSRCGSSPGMVHRSLSGGSEIGVMPAMNVAPRSVSTPTEAPFDPWMWTLVWIPGFWTGW